MAKKEKRKNNLEVNKRSHTLFYIILLLALVVLFTFLLINSYNEYHSFSSHRAYLRNSTFKQIESWMPPRTILKHFNITSEHLFTALNVTNTTANLIKPISTICLDKKENCTLITSKLNSVLK